MSGELSGTSRGKIHSPTLFAMVVEHPLAALAALGSALFLLACLASGLLMCVWPLATSSDSSAVVLWSFVSFIISGALSVLLVILYEKRAYRWTRARLLRDALNNELVWPVAIDKTTGIRLGELGFPDYANGQLLSTLLVVTANTLQIWQQRGSDLQEVLEISKQAIASTSTGIVRILGSRRNAVTVELYMPTSPGGAKLSFVPDGGKILANAKVLHRVEESLVH